MFLDLLRSQLSASPAASVESGFWDDGEAGDEIVQALLGQNTNRSIGGGSSEDPKEAAHAALNRCGRQTFPLILSFFTLRYQCAECSWSHGSRIGKFIQYKIGRVSYGVYLVTPCYIVVIWRKDPGRSNRLCG